jgi:hypothetical protein
MENTSWHVAVETGSTGLLEIIMEPAKGKITTKQVVISFCLNKRLLG